MDRVETLALGCVLASFDGLDAPDWLRRRAAAGLGGVVLFGRNVADPSQVVALTAALHAERGGCLVATDEEGGDVTRLEAATGSSYPGAGALGAVDDVRATRAVACSLGVRLRAAGIDVDLAPCGDVNSNPANPVIGVRSFGSQSDLVARHVAAFVGGVQAAGVAACVKHFPGHGDTSRDSHVDLPIVDAPVEVLTARELVPFRAGIAAGAAAVMSAHVVVPAWDQRPATTSRRILVDLLRGELGFTGALITDALDMAGASGSTGIPATAAHALAAGADLLCLGPRTDEGLLDAVVTAIATAVRSGALAEGRLVEAADRANVLAGRVSGATADRADVDVDADVQVDDHFVDDHFLLHVARRAITIEGGPITPLRHAVVVTCRPPAGIAAGPVPWGVAEPLRALDPTTSSYDLWGPAFDERDLDKILVDAVDRPLVIVVRDAHRHRWSIDVIDVLRRSRPDLVLVEMGWPGALTASAVRTRSTVTTHGASRVSGEAAARLLAGGTT